MSHKHKYGQFDEAQSATFNPGKELITGWANFGSGYDYETLTVNANGHDIDVAENTSPANAHVQAGPISIEAGRIYACQVNLTPDISTPGQLPGFGMTSAAGGAGTNYLTIAPGGLSAGLHTFLVVPSTTTIWIYFNNSAAAKWGALVSFAEIPLKINGDVYFAGNARVVIPTFANNAAALAGGLVAGQLYRVNAAIDPEPIYIVH